MGKEGINEAETLACSPSLDWCGLCRLLLSVVKLIPAWATAAFDNNTCIPQFPQQTSCFALDYFWTRGVLRLFLRQTSALIRRWLILDHGSIRLYTSLHNVNHVTQSALSVVVEGPGLIPSRERTVRPHTSNSDNKKNEQSKHIVVMFGFWPTEPPDKKSCKWAASWETSLTTLF